MQWSFASEYQLPSRAVLTLWYVGQHGTHLMVPEPYLQKLIVNGKVVGAIQISRKGKPGEPVGPDFTPRDMGAASYQSEAELEREFIKLLQSQAYDYLPIASEAQLIANVRRFKGKGVPKGFRVFSVERELQDG